MSRDSKSYSQEESIHVPFKSYGVPPPPPQEHSTHPPLTTHESGHAGALQPGESYATFSQSEQTVLLFLSIEPYFKINHILIELS